MMSTDNVARAIAERHGIPHAQATRIALAVAHRHRTTMGYPPPPYLDGPDRRQDRTDPTAIAAGALAQEICGLCALTLGDALLIAHRLIARARLLVSSEVP